MDFLNLATSLVIQAFICFFYFIVWMQKEILTAHSTIFGAPVKDE